MRSFVCVVLGFIVSVTSVGCNCFQGRQYDPATGMVYPSSFKRPSLFSKFGKKKKHDAATCPLCNPHGVVNNDPHGHSHDGHSHDGHAQPHVHHPGSPNLPVPVSEYGITPVSGVNGDGSGIVQAGHHVEHAHHNGGRGQVTQAGHNGCSCAAPNPVPVHNVKRNCSGNQKGGCSCGKSCHCGNHGQCGANRTPQHSSSGHKHNCGNCGGYISSGCNSPCEVVGPCDTFASPVVNGGIISGGCSTCGTAGSHVSSFGGSVVSDGVIYDGGTYEGTVIPGQIVSDQVTFGDHSNCPTCNANKSGTPGPLFNGEKIPGQIEPHPEPAKVPPAADYDEKSDAGLKPGNATRTILPVPTPTKDVSVEDEFIEPNRLNPTTMMIPSIPVQKSQTRHVHWTPSSVPVFEVE
jgi:hypothetical protein